MDLKQISYILTIARTGNMTKAAEQIHISQSALSQSYRNLEQELGVTLFQKEGRSLRLTDAGLLFCEKGAQLLEHAAAFQNLMEQQKYIQLHTLNYYTDVVDNCDETIMQYQSFFPNIRFERNYCTEEAAVRSLKNGTLDFSLTLRAIDDPDLHCQCLVDEPVVVLVSRRSSLAGRVSIRVKDLTGETLIVYQNAEHLKDLFLDFFAEAGAAPGRILQLYDPVLQIQQNNGFIFMPESTFRCFKARRILENCEGIPVTDSFCRRRVFLSRDGKREPGPVCNGFFAYLRDYHALSQREHCLPEMDRFTVRDGYLCRTAQNS